MNRPLRFHWSLSQAGDTYRGLVAKDDMTGLLSFDAQLELCRCAEISGIDSVLMAIGYTRPDPLLLSVALGRETDRLKFMVACRSGLQSPTLFVQQVNTLSALIGGRVHLNVVAGHTPAEQRAYGDQLAHDERFDRTAEFLTICNGLWRGEASVDFTGRYYTIENARVRTPFVSPEAEWPEIYIGGNSERAATLAAEHGDTLWRFPDTPDALRDVVRSVRAAGREVGLLAGIIARPTTAEAVEAAYRMVRGFDDAARGVHERFISKSDSVAYVSTHNRAADACGDWLSPTLWAGAVPYMGATAMALVGGVEEIAESLMEYKRIGISQFLFMGWPPLEEVRFFGESVLPLVRRLEAAEPIALNGSDEEPTTTLFAQ